METNSRVARKRQPFEFAACCDFKIRMSLRKLSKLLPYLIYHIPKLPQASESSHIHDQWLLAMQDISIIKNGLKSKSISLQIHRYAIHMKVFFFQFLFKRIRCFRSYSILSILYGIFGYLASFLDHIIHPKKIRQAIMAKIKPARSAVNAAAKVCRIRRICTAPK